MADGFDEQCEFCHGTVSWAGGFFNHERQLAGLVTECVDCHQQKYDQTRDPDHEVIGFPVDCQPCHNTRDWEDGIFDHDSQWFPVYSGKHREEWDTCSRCHPSNANYAEFTCLSCHPHNDQRDTDDKHSELVDYEYDSIECLRCHPRGRKEEE